MGVDEGTKRGVELDQAIRTLIEESGEAARAYLKQVWLSRAMDGLSSARKVAGLTQAQLAERLGTTQSAVARVENDDAGGISLRRYADFALACGAFSPDLELVPLDDMLAYVSASPSAPRKGMDLAVWKMVLESMAGAGRKEDLAIHSSQAPVAGLTAGTAGRQIWGQCMTDQAVFVQDCPTYREEYRSASPNHCPTGRSATRRAKEAAHSQNSGGQVAEDQKVAA